MSNAEKGIGLILALIVLALLSLLVAATLTAVTVDVWVGDNYRTEAQLVYLTEAGIEDGREALKAESLVPSLTPFIKDRPLLDTTGREAGRYSVTFVRSNPPTLRSAGSIGNANKTIEVRLRKTGFPKFPDAIVLNEDLPLAAGMDPRLETPQELERIVDGIVRNATDVYSPAWGETVRLGSIGSSEDYRVVVVNGDCEFGDGAGRGILLVRGELTVHGTFSWNGLILVIGQGVMRSSGVTLGWISGGIFLTRSRDVDRSPLNPLGTLRARRGNVVFDLPATSVTVEQSNTEMDRSNRRFPYVQTAYREY